MDPRRGEQTITQYVVHSRLARALTARDLEDEERETGLSVIGACRDATPADEWLTARGAPPAPTLRGETIAELDVCYPATTLPEQRRYAEPFVCIAALSRRLRVAASAGLCVDGDLVATELVAFAHACERAGAPCEVLRAHLAWREEQLAELGAFVPPTADRRGFAKAVVSAVVHQANSRSLYDNAGQPNAVAALFEEHGGVDVARARAVDWPEENRNTPSSLGTPLQRTIQHGPTGVSTLLTASSPDMGLNLGWHPTWTRLPSWLHALSRECRANAPFVVNARAHAPTLAMLRTHMPEKARNVSSALHYVLAPYEFRAISGVW
jgi:hypothetical protein